ncbi:GNAT family N-acetyltransferase [Marinimicrobium alkaliphilum]|uniref:GNAT family N-acetyltransferase n=1 Tax=Marinimicrobium alkaliphilum TaxID=2202654 RepID=UPI000DBA2344|nr:GNAT family N-acetyltransferase [Marinimicrobium alkaliphilum]
MHWEFVDTIHALSPAQWDRLCPDDYPFTRHRFLAALEDSGSTSAERGWQPHHLIGRSAQGDATVALPLYLKQHSYGEYVFDWSWADAYQRFGLDYYPKLVNAIPFTPCVGPRLLCGAAAPEDYADGVARALTDECERLGLSGWHCLFPDPSLSRALATQGAAQRHGCQFHWHNRGYRDFDEFLAQLASRKRKNLRKERQGVEAQGLRFRWQTGAELGPEDWQRFHVFYQMTYLKRSGHGGYLTGDCFRRLGETCADQSLMVTALSGDQPVAAALYFFDRDTLYGRYWGCLDEFNGLHFETCYYQGIDFCIARGLKRFDGGAQGEHKIARGFEPVATWSNHWLRAPEFAEPIRQFMREEAHAVAAYHAEAQTLLPYKSSTTSSSNSQG